MKHLKKSALIMVLLIVCSMNMLFAQTFKRFEVKEKTGEVLVVETKKIPAQIIPKDRYGDLPSLRVNRVVYWEYDSNLEKTVERNVRFRGDVKLPEKTSAFEVSTKSISKDDLLQVVSWATTKENRKNYGYKDLPTDVSRLNAKQILVWCNAFSESRGLQPVYYTKKGSVYRDAGKMEGITIDANANGYRVPFISECYVMENLVGMKLPTNEIATARAGLIKTGCSDKYGNDIYAVYNWTDQNMYRASESRVSYNFYVVKNK